MTPAATTMSSARATDQIAARKLVCDCISRKCQEAFKDQLRSVVLTGSMARDEATILSGAEGSVVLGDADLMVVFQNWSPLPEGRFVAALAAACETDLHRSGLSVHVSMSAAHEDFFRKLPANIFSYELRVCGRVAWGDTSVLDAIPVFAANAIAREDAWRMLSNRMIEFSEFVPELLGDRRGLSEGLRYGTVKLFLDMATSLLVFVGGYGPSYRDRAETLQRLVHTPDTRSLPAGSNELAQYVSRCTRWKLAAADGKDDFSPEFAQAALIYACRLWLWELAQLTDSSEASSPHYLVEALAARQTSVEKLRGWLYVIRRTGWLRSLPRLPRWVRMALRQTPRYYIYQAAFELSSILSERQSNELTNAIMRHIRSLLPTADDNAASELTWQAAAHEVLRNYRSFLLETRA